MSIDKKRITVVLGMHRNDSSILARSLVVLGVDLGENLMPAIPDINGKCFTEDVDPMSLNIGASARFNTVRLNQ